MRSKMVHLSSKLAQYLCRNQLDCSQPCDRSVLLWNLKQQSIKQTTSKDRVCRSFCCVIVSVADKSDINLMTANNLAVIFGPTLMKSNKWVTFLISCFTLFHIFTSSLSSLSQGGYDKNPIILISDLSQFKSWFKSAIKSCLQQLLLNKK